MGKLGSSTLNRTANFFNEQEVTKVNGQVRSRYLPTFRLPLFMAIIITGISFFVPDSINSGCENTYINYYYPLFTSTILCIFSLFFFAQAIFRSNDFGDILLTAPYLMFNLLNILSLTIIPVNYTEYIYGFSVLIIVWLLALGSIQVVRLFARKRIVIKANK